MWHSAGCSKSHHQPSGNSCFRDIFMKQLPGWIFKHYLCTQSPQTWGGVRFITIIPVYMQWALGWGPDSAFCNYSYRAGCYLLKTSVDITSMSNCGCSLISSSLPPPSSPAWLGVQVLRVTYCWGDVSKVGLPDPISIPDQLAGQLDAH